MCLGVVHEILDLVTGVKTIMVETSLPSSQTQSLLFTFVALSLIVFVNVVCVDHNDQSWAVYDLNVVNCIKSKP